MAFRHSPAWYGGEPKERKKMNTTEGRATLARTIYITDHDKNRLKKLIKDARDASPSGTDLKDLEAELDRARVVAP